MEIEQLIQYAYDNPTETYDHYGLPVATIDGAEYAIATSAEEAETACSQYIEQSVWSFNASFLASHIDALEEGDIERHYNAGTLDAKGLCQLDSLIMERLLDEK